jgi:hypothetical protein
MTEETVKLTSPVWEYVALRENDPYLSELIPPPGVLGDAKEVEIPLSLATILASEWDQYMRLRRILDVPWVIYGKLDQRIYDVHTSTQPTYILSEVQVLTLRDLLSGWLLRIHREIHNVLPTKGLYDGSKYEVYEARTSGHALVVLRTTLDETIYLADISHIINIANLPRNWEFAVVVDARTPQSERIHYARRLGEIMANNLFVYALPYLPLRARVLVVLTHEISLGLGSYRGPYFNYLAGMLIMAERRMEDTSKPTPHTTVVADNILDWHGVIWDDIILGLNLIQEETGISYSNSTIPRTAYNTVAYMVNDESYDPAVPLLDYYNTSKDLMEGKDIPLFEALAERDHYFQLPVIDYLSNVEHRDRTMAMDRYITSVMQGIVRELQVRSRTVRMEYKRLIDKIETIMGRYVLSLLLVRILRYMEFDPNSPAYSNYDTFAKMLEKRLSIR